MGDSTSKVGDWEKEKISQTGSQEVLEEEEERRKRRSRRRSRSGEWDLERAERETQSRKGGEGEKNSYIVPHDHQHLKVTPHR